MRKPTIKKKFRAEFCALKNAIDRCYRTNHPQYQDYGGRGITVDPEFACPVTGFVAFLADVGKKPHPSLTLERKCNDRGYEPGNLEWVSRSDNQKNRRPSCARTRDLGWGIGRYWTTGRDGRRLAHKSALLGKDGNIQTVKAWSVETGLASHTIIQRVLRGWPIEQVLDPVLFCPRGTPRNNPTIH